MICWTPAGNADAPGAREKYRAVRAQAIDPRARMSVSSRTCHVEFGTRAYSKPGARNRESCRVEFAFGFVGTATLNRERRSG